MITKKEDYDGAPDSTNKILGTFPVMKDSVIDFRGRFNILFCEEGVYLKNVQLNFCGDRSLI